MNQKNSAFTIVEMAVVVFIIGLLITGVMAGKNLIEGGRTRAVLGEMDENRQAMLQFQEKYFDWPGDITNASTYWPGATNASGPNAGNEQINWATEGVLMWHHLELAQMIGQTGFSNTVTPDAIIGSNVPGSKISGAGWFANYDSVHKNYLGLGAQRSTNTGVNDSPVIEPKRAYDIDMKIDDGNPTTGLVQSDGSPSADCYSGTSYNLANQSPACMMMFTIKTR